MASAISRSESITNGPYCTTRSPNSYSARTERGDIEKTTDYGKVADKSVAHADPLIAPDADLEWGCGLRRCGMAARTALLHQIERGSASGRGRDRQVSGLRPNDADAAQCYRLQQLHGAASRVRFDSPTASGQNQNRWFAA